VTTSILGRAKLTQFLPHPQQHSLTIFLETLEPFGFGVIVCMEADRMVDGNRIFTLS